MRPRRLLQTLLPALACWTLILSAAAQTRVLEGVVTDEDGTVVPGARVAAVGSGLPAYADEQGHYRVAVAEATQRVQVTAPEYEAIEVFIGTVNRVDFVLPHGLGSGDVSTLGGQRPGRTQAGALLPVEVVYSAEARAAEPYATLGQVLTMATTSLTALPQSSGTPADFVDPLGVSGASASQVVLLVNGKRRHRTAYVSTGDVFGRGGVGYDLATLPLAAVERVEVLRGPAAALYGEGAVVGVVNVLLRRDLGLTATAEAGGYVSGNLPSGTDAPDGRFYQASVGYGRELGRRGGFAHVTAVAARREPTNRMESYSGAIFSGYNGPNAGEGPSGDITAAELARRELTREDFREGAGQAAEDRLSVVANVEFPLAGAWTLYGSGDFTVRRAEATGRYALPNEARTNTALYPNGFAPLIEGTLDDQSALAGARGRWRGWEVDVSSSYGRSGIALAVSNTANAALGPNSSRDFDAGGAAFFESVTRADVRRYYPDQLAGIHLAGGAGFRFEDYNVYSGEGGSYGGPAGVTDPLGRAVPTGAQGLRGFSDADRSGSTRSGAFGYVDVEVDVFPRLSLAAGVRYEGFGGLGGGAMADLRSRLRLNDAIDLRGGLSSGLRAPTLQETAYRATYPTATGGRAGVFPADGPAARALGLEPLSLERHLGASGGLVARWERARVEVSADAFLVDVEGAAGLTGEFGGDPTRLDVDQLLANVGVERAAFLTNAYDTRTAGVTLGVRHNSPLPRGAQLRLFVSGTYARTGVEAVGATPQLFDRAAVFLSPANRSLFDAAIPRLRGLATAHVDYGDFTLLLRANYFGEVEAYDRDSATEQVYAGKLMGDASLTWRPRGRFGLTAGASNVLDVYPDRSSAALADNGRALYSRTAQQFGANGRYVFARLSYGLGR